MGVAIVVAIGVGIAVASQVAIVGQASRSIHPLTVSLALQASGLLIAIGWAIWSRTWPQIAEVAQQWWWIPLGVLGWGIVAALGFSAARMGASSTLAIVITAQLIAALLLDRFVGRIEVSFQAAAGALLLVVGALLITSSARSSV
jgi:transporter family-2 protein